jgi:hypothetical protein
MLHCFVSTVRDFSPSNRRVTTTNFIPNVAVLLRIPEVLGSILCPQTDGSKGLCNFPRSLQENDEMCLQKHYHRLIHILLNHPTNSVEKVEKSRSHSFYSSKGLLVCLLFLICIDKFFSGSKFLASSWHRGTNQYHRISCFTNEYLAISSSRYLRQDEAVQGSDTDK